MLVCLQDPAIHHQARVLLLKMYSDDMLGFHTMRRGACHPSLAIIAGSVCWILLGFVYPLLQWAGLQACTALSAGRVCGVCVDVLIFLGA
jgi:hypothetical protein